jgi:hypothetical protein
MVGYLTTNENGEFEGTIQGLSAGTYKLKAEFEGDSGYNPSFDEKYFNVVSPDVELSLTATAQIIQIGDTTTITATLTEGGLPFVNEEVEYEIITSSGTTSGSDFTNNAGQITFTYTGDGAGDIVITASYDNLEETIPIEDCIFYGDMNAVKSTFEKNTSVSGRIIYYPDAIYNQDVELSWKFKNNIPNQFLIGFANPLAPFTTKLSLYRNANQQYIFYYSDTSRNNQEYVLGMNPSVNDIFKITSENINKLYMHLNSALEGYRDTNTSLPLQLRIDDFNNTMDLDFIKIKVI